MFRCEHKFMKSAISLFNDDFNALKKSIKNIIANDRINDN